MHFLDKRVVKDLLTTVKPVHNQLGENSPTKGDEPTKAITDFNDHEGVIQDFAG